MTHLLVADAIRFGYDPSVPLLDGWSARFRRGEAVAVTGPSGRGKSTLLYLLGLMLRPTGGVVRFQGREVSDLPDAARARLRAMSFGFVFQDAALDSTRTVLDNVLETALYRGEPRDAAAPRAMALLERFGVELQATARPGQVSGGQAQRIALCRALLGDPDVLLADEPTGNLDAAAADAVLAAFRAHADSGRLVIVVTHDPKVARRCDRELRL